MNPVLEKMAWWDFGKKRICMMKNHMWKWGVVLLTALLFSPGCGPDFPLEKEEIALRVNESKITLEEFNDLLKLEAYADPEIDVTTDTRAQFVKYLVCRELMIQEAAKLKLDTKKEFIQTIEKYWEATLIRNLLDLKSAELKKKILITEDEIEAYHADHKDEFSRSPGEVRAKIIHILESGKLAKKMEVWTQRLEKSADIIINKTLINGN